MADRHDEEDDEPEGDKSRADRDGKWPLPIRPSTVIFWTQCVVLIKEVLDVLGR